jgi:hypothetical protein
MANDYNTWMDRAKSSLTISKTRCITGLFTLGSRLRGNLRASRRLGLWFCPGHSAMLHFHLPIVAEAASCPNFRHIFTVLAA